MPYCQNCARDLSPAAATCPQCGHPGPAATAAPARTEGFAVASLACSVGVFTVVPLVGAILGIIFGYAARRRIAADPSLEGDAMASAGIIVGWVGVALAIIIVLLVVSLIPFDAIE